MSDVESYTGILKPVNLKGKTFEQYAESKCLKLGVEDMRDCYDSWVETLTVEANKKYYWSRENEILYKVKLTVIDNEGFIEMSEGKNGSLKFITSFYNGGTNLSEMLDEGIESIL